MSDLVSQIAQILEPWAWETKSWNATVARDDATAKAEQIVELLSLSTPKASAETAIPAGWKLVPVEPTEAMLEEACFVDIEIYPTNIPSGLTAANEKEARSIWAVMLSAAPTPPDAGSGSDAAGEVEKIALAVERADLFDDGDRLKNSDPRVTLAAIVRSFATQPGHGGRS